MPAPTGVLKPSAHGTLQEGRDWNPILPDDAPGFAPLRFGGEPEAPRIFGENDPGRACPDCGEVLGSVLEANGIVAIWRAPEHDCPARLARAAEEAQAYAEQHTEWLKHPPTERIADVIRRAHLPAWVRSGLDEVDRSKVWNPALDLFLHHRTEWLAGRRPERGVWLVGPTGARKTLLVSALFFDLANRTGHAVRIENLADLAEQIRLDAQGKQSDYDPVALQQAQALGLDDLGYEKASERTLETLTNLVSRAYNAWGRPEGGAVLYVTSNDNPHLVAEQLTPPSKPGKGVPLVRRLTQLCELIEIPRNPAGH